MSTAKTAYPPTRDKETIDRMVTDYLPLVRYIVGRLPLKLPYFMDEDDLFSVGVLGLINAAKSYDPNLEASFKTHAYTNIKGAILDELRRHDSIPRSVRDRIKKVEEATAHLVDKTGRVPTPEEIAKEAQIPLKALNDLLHSARSNTLLSLNNLGDHGGDAGSLLRPLSQEEDSNPVARAEKSELIGLLMKSIKNLPETERQVVFLYYNQNLLLKEIGAVLEVSESRVSQILSRAHFLLNKAIKHRGG